MFSLLFLSDYFHFFDSLKNLENSESLLVNGAERYEFMTEQCSGQKWKSKSVADEYWTFLVSAVFYRISVVVYFYCPLSSISMTMYFICIFITSSQKQPACTAAIMSECRDLTEWPVCNHFIVTQLYCMLGIHISIVVFLAFQMRQHFLNGI